MSFVDPASSWYHALVPVIIYVISYNIGPRYNGTRLQPNDAKSTQEDENIAHVWP